MTTETQTTEQQVEKFLKDEGIEFKFVFMPQNYAEVDVKCKTYDDYSSLQYDWKVLIGGQEFEYHTGLGHQKITANIPQGLKVHDAETIKWAVCGKKYMTTSMNGTGKLYLKEPEIASVLYCILLDGEAIEYTFPEWADMFGYDTDSRKAEQVYNACIEEGRKLRNIFSPADLDTLREMLQDY